MVKAVVGLRNPGLDYVGTRHNVGFEVIEVLCDRHGVSLSSGPARVRADVGDFRSGADRVVLAAPQAFMNESGRSVASLLSYFKIEIDDLLVIHDDIDLPFGRLKVQFGGGNAGHNGLKSVERSLGTNEFTRLKVGVGRPPGRMDPAAFVLQRFSGTEREEIDFLVEDGADVVEEWVTDPIRAQQTAGSRRPGGPEQL